MKIPDTKHGIINETPIKENTTRIEQIKHFRIFRAFISRLDIGSETFQSFFHGQGRFLRPINLRIMQISEECGRERIDPGIFEGISALRNSFHIYLRKLAFEPVGKSLKIVDCDETPFLFYILESSEIFFLHDTTIHAIKHKNLDEIKEKFCQSGECSLHCIINIIHPSNKRKKITNDLHDFSKFAKICDSIGIPKDLIA